MSCARVLVSTLACLAASVVGAQPQPARRTAESTAESALAAGRIDEVERLLYDASRRSPRDPAARTALGAFLAARGQLRVGAVLLEEARLFGGDARGIDERLLRICSWIGVWDLGVEIPGAAHVSVPQRAQLTWLSHHPESLAGPESVVVRLEPHETAGLGRVEIVVGGLKFDADVDPSVEGLVMPPSPQLLRGVEIFGSEEDETFGAARTLAFGALRITNVPLRLTPRSSPRVGLDVIGRLRPTFDPVRRTLTLYAAAGAGPPGARELPVLLGFPGVRIVAGAGSPPVPLESAAGRAAVRGARWRLDLRRGAVVLTP